MNGRLAVQDRKKATVLPASRFLQHTAVLPVADHAAQSEPANASTESRFGQDLSQVATHSESGAARSELAPPCPVTPTHCPFGGACHTCPVRVQAKLASNQPGDEYEQEADRVADQLTGAPRAQLQRQATSQEEPTRVPPIVHEVLRSPGQPLDVQTRAFMEPRFGHDFSGVQVHTDVNAAKSARAVSALAYTVGRDVVFGAGHYAPQSEAGRKLMAHELTHVVQQSAFSAYKANIGVASDSSQEEHSAEATADAIMAGRTLPTIAPAGVQLQCREAPFIKRITVHLTPSQSADLEWEGTPPANAAGSDHFTVSTGKGYSDPGDPPGTCTRTCCNDPMTQCAPPWNQPGRVGACCTYYGNSFWTGTPLEEHNTWKWWTPIQPYYSSRGIALHQHTEVTGEPIGHGCVRMLEPNAKRIYDFSNGRRTNVTIDGRAAPVACEPDRRCAASGGTRGELGEGAGENQFALLQEAVPGLEGLLT